MCRWEIQTYGLIIWSPDGRIVVWVVVVVVLVVLGIMLLSWVRYAVTVVDTALVFTGRFLANLCYAVRIVCQQRHLILRFACHSPRRLRFDSRPVIVNLWCTGWHLDSLFFYLRTLFIPCQYYFTIASCGWLGYVRRWQTVVLCMGWGWRDSWASGSGLIWHSAAV